MYVERNRSEPILENRHGGCFTRNVPGRFFTALLAVALCAGVSRAGPYAPAAGQAGSTALDKGDSAFVGWATGWFDYVVGTECVATWQTPAKALGAATGDNLDIVCLGNGGEITLAFGNPIVDGPGPDLAVFENGVEDTFLELAYVEVSSNGNDFFRFPNRSLTPDPVTRFGAVDPTNVSGLAGKYRQGFGTPFDLGTLSDVSPLLDVNNVGFVRIQDVVGDGTYRDTSGSAIYDPHPTILSGGFDLEAVGVLNAMPDVVDFDDLALEPESHWQGPAPNGYDEEDPWGGMRHVGTFQSGGVEFLNRYNAGFDAWSGFAYSNTTDVATAVHTNQFSAYTGSGYGPGEDNYGVVFGYADFLEEADEETFQERFQELPYFELPEGVGIKSARVTNTTYAALSMLHGNAFATKFGGAFGSSPDWFKLTAYGTDASGELLPETVEFYLADYRFSDDGQDYIVDEWELLDLSSLAGASRVHFNLTSSDVGFFGMNTPGYFAIDNIVLDLPDRPSIVTGRHVFYAHSAFDALGPAGAVATDKRALLPAQQTAGFENYTSHPDGITGIIIDFDNLPDPSEISPSDFEFRIGNDNDVDRWPSAVAPGISVEMDGGEGGADRIVFIWPDGTIVDTWVQVTVDAPWLVRKDVFYFGNAAGETGNGGSDALVSSADVIGARGHPRGAANPAAIDDPFDVNRDGWVDALDVIAIRDAANSPLSSLRFIAPGAAPSAAPAPSAVPEPSTWTLFVFGLAVIASHRRRQLRFFISPPSFFGVRLMRIAALRSLRGLLAIGIVSLASGNALAVTVDLDDLTLGVESYWNGSDLSGTPEPGPWDTTQYIGGFASRGVQFINRYNADWLSWSGFAYSNMTDTVTPGFGNQYSSFVGGGATPGDDNFAVTYGYVGGLNPADVSMLEQLPYFEIPAGMRVEGVFVTNTTYGAQSMLLGDAYAKQFGGPTGDDPDWFKLTAYGTDASGSPLSGAVDFLLADFSFSDNSLDYVVDTWSFVDLSPLAGAKRVYFNLTSSDVGAAGMNTPAVFALDAVVLAPVPEPSTLALFVGAGLTLLGVRLRRNRTL